MSKNHLGRGKKNGFYGFCIEGWVTNGLSFQKNCQEELITP